MARSDSFDDDDDFDDDDRPVKKKKKKRSAEDKSFLGFLTFRTMVGTYLLIGLYWLLVLGFIIGGFGIVIASLMNMQRVGAAGTVFMSLYGLGVAIGGPIVYRVVFEMMMLMYRMHEALQEIRDNTRS